MEVISSFTTVMPIIGRTSHPSIFRRKSKQVLTDKSASSQPLRRKCALSSVLETPLTTQGEVCTELCARGHSDYLLCFLCFTLKSPVCSDPKSKML